MRNQQTDGAVSDQAFQEYQLGSDAATARPESEGGFARCGILSGTALRLLQMV